MGRLQAARSHLEQARKAYSSQQHSTYIFLAGFDLGVFTLAHLSHAMGYLGYPDQALHLGQEGVALAKSVGHPFSQVAALSYLGDASPLYGDWRAMQVASASAPSLRRT
ncbi:MAG: hypothetical protein M9927_11430 [Anaerolineae bacterium]|nr:hypothetical protein [Anaerolineae bacterium]